MTKIIGFAGSNSSTSINAQLVDYVLHELTGAEVAQINLVDFHIPIYSMDIEKSSGIPQEVTHLKETLHKADALVISVNEYNGALSGFFKNILDWLSRADRNFLEGIPILLMSSSTGGGGGGKALDYAKNSFPRFGGKIIEAFSFPSFHENFTDGKVTNTQLAEGIKQVTASFLAAI